jgi:hypothetical protein
MGFVVLDVPSVALLSFETASAAARGALGTSTGVLEPLATFFDPFNPRIAFRPFFATSSSFEGTGSSVPRGIAVCVDGPFERFPNIFEGNFDMITIQKVVEMLMIRRNVGEFKVVCRVQLGRPSLFRWAATSTRLGCRLGDKNALI